jgi:Fanconi anemia group M protein
MATQSDVGSISHPLIVDGALEERAYQLELAAQARDGHTLVCLPTGLGKTTVSALVTAHRLDTVGGTAMLLAPTKPLVQQHRTFYREVLDIDPDRVVALTGDTAPADRATAFADAAVVIATPQVVENDLIGSRIDLTDVTHVTFDECHRATGNYAYVYIAERYHADAADPLVTGMSASPGGDEAAILQVCSNLGIDAVAVMTEEDADVAAHTHTTDVEWEQITLPPELLAIRDTVQEVIDDRLDGLRQLGVLSGSSSDLSHRQMNQIRGRLQGLIDRDAQEGYQGMSLHAEVMKLRRAVELIETQSVASFRRYLDRQDNAARSSGASKATQRLIGDPAIQRAIGLADAYDGTHPKFSRARILLAQTLGVEGGSRVIIFTESRDTAEALVAFLAPSFDVRRFVGQGDRSGSAGMTQREQQETLDAFRAGEFEVLVSTSVAEEGLDVPDVDLVLFFEPVPTAIRSIQRKGRTGRQAPGRVVVLLAEDTRDEAYFWISRRREKQMHNELAALKRSAPEIESSLEGATDARPAGQAGLADFDADDAADPTAASDGAEVEVVIDQREMHASIARTLSQHASIATRLETLAVGDYICSDRVAIERKTVDDFLETLVGEDRSLFAQVGALADAYARPVVVIEGEGLYDRRNIHPNAIRGALASLVTDYGCSILQTADADATAALIATIATREQTDRDRRVTVHGQKASRTLREQQEYVVASIADIGPVSAQRLLAAFGSVEAVLTASAEELESVHGVGEVTAERIRRVVGSTYQD